MAKKKKLKVGIIGTGGISGVHHNGYMKSPDADLVAICDIKPDVLKRRGEAWDIPEEMRFTDHREMLKKVPELDAVSVCTPNKSHCECTVNSLKAGKHVLCEKPIASNADEAERMAEASDKTGCALVEAFHWRYHPLARRMLDVMESGVLGKLRHIETWMCIPIPLPGDIRYRF